MLLGEGGTQYNDIYHTFTIFIGPDITLTILVFPGAPNAPPMEHFWPEPGPRAYSAPLLSITSKPGEPLFLAGDAGEGCYRLERGLLKIVITSARGEERILATLGPGEIAGELAIIDGQPRSASVFAVRDCELSFISRKDFEECTRQQLRAPVPLHTMTSAVPLRHNSGIKVN
jgi:hypothetical protein